ncbi:hypothetical protein BVI2075_610023 [Burkholderia vietnamiensis]|nr:hypothetical protein BVI2075_610023 [Burkholderia vietnamiensis]
MQPPPNILLPTRFNFGHTTPKKTTGIAVNKMIRRGQKWVFISLNMVKIPTSCSPSRTKCWARRS